MTRRALVLALLLPLAAGASGLARAETPQASTGAFGDGPLPPGTMVLSPAKRGYVTAPRAGGRGLARAMAEHSLIHARERGFRAMQFNFVIATNGPAVHLWTALDFAIVGTLPGAFHHPTLGEVDALVMYRRL